jgi:hypothetical protein
LAALVEAKFLREVPLDPYGGAPLHLRRLNDGLVIYSISVGNDDPRKELEEWGEDAELVGYRLRDFRLWDVSHRRQPAPPPRAPEKEKRE